MNSTEIKLKDICIEKIDKHILELLELKRLINDGIETREKLKNIFDYITETKWKYNDMSKVGDILAEYSHVLNIIYK